MREIKFRAWDTELKYMLDYCNHHPIKAIGSGNGLEYMQYTGLKDQNGKEIYEGDIVSNGNGVIHTIAFSDGCFWWGQAPLNIVKRMEKLYPAIYKYHEVIGNIYENKELL